LPQEIKLALSLLPVVEAVAVALTSTPMVQLEKQTQATRLERQPVHKVKTGVAMAPVVAVAVAVLQVDLVELLPLMVGAQVVKVVSLVET
jgi:hypothetical protein